MKTNMAAPLKPEGEMDINGETRTVSFLRVGRVALVTKRSMAKKAALGISTGQFIDLDGDFDSQLRSALRIAKQQAAPDLLVVPVTVGQ